jgi:heme/copper-type cytochrome/quinol oxidase subunit 2
MILAILHGDRMDLIYFWSSLLIVALPLTVFSVLTYLVVKASRKREPGAGSREQKAAP